MLIRDSSADDARRLQIYHCSCSAYLVLDMRRELPSLPVGTFSQHNHGQKRFEDCSRGLREIWLRYQRLGQSLSSVAVN
jgi:hypothetical protein